jgi:signal transduction histidine kinase
MADIKKHNSAKVNRGSKKKNSGIFIKARWKLTVFYTLFISIVVILFSSAIYFGYLYYLRGAFENELTGEDHGSESELGGSEDQGNTSQFSITPQEISANASRRLGIIILIADGCIIAVSAFLGYALAGFTLKPIQNNQDAQRRFMSDASHELRTPLSIMKTGIEVELRNPGNPLECKPILNSNLEEINRMADLVENLLFILRVDSGNENFKFEILDLSQIISSVIQNMKPYAAQRKVDLISANVPTGLLITGDLNKLKQAFYNILKNAVDYSKPGGQVQLTVLKQPKTAQIEITDKGIGIPVEELPFVFERFFRSSNNSGRYNNGSGLGLAITKEIIEKHKGEIKIESSFGNWTKVTMSLPY